jgi:cytochrome bd-type quinol oxidase subunit 1
MKTLYSVTSFALLIGLAILCCFAPWTTTPVGSPAAHDSLGYAAIWSQRFAAVAGARVDPGAFMILAGVVAFFAIVIGAAAYFFRTKRGSEREDV